MMARFLATTAVVCLVPVAVAAQAADTDESKPKTPNTVGVYQGVVPGEVNPPAVKVPPGGGTRQATWPGFQMLPNGGSRFFVQLTSETSVDAEMQPDKMVITLKNTAIAGPTNSFSLETRYFNTPVKRARLKAKDADTLLLLDMRKEIMPVVSKEGGRDGYFFIYVDFPPGNYMVEEQPPGVPTAKSADAKKSKSKASGSASAGASASGEASFSASVGISKKKLKAMDEEKPPPVKIGGGAKAGGKASGGFKFGK
jgi:hypothetical protein